MLELVYTIEKGEAQANMRNTEMVEIGFTYQITHEEREELKMTQRFPAQIEWVGMTGIKRERMWEKEQLQEKILIWGECGGAEELFKF